MTADDIGPDGATRATLLDVSGACRDAARWAADSAACAARYFRERRPEAIAADLARLARERPGQTLAAAAVLGAVVGIALHGLSRR